MTRLPSTLILTLLVVALAGVPAGGVSPLCTKLTLDESMLAETLTQVEPSVDGSVVWGLYWNGVKRSADYGANWATVKVFSRGTSAFRGLFVDTNDNLFISRNDMGVLVKAEWAGGDTLTCTDVLTFDCASCPSADCDGFWHMAEDSAGNLYGGEYNGNATTDTCAVIWKSTDSGDNWTRIRWAQGSRHVHFVAVNPYDDALIASLGDGTGERMVLKSTNAGTTFTALHNTSCLSQPISFAFTSDLMLLGSDCSTEDQANRVYSMAADGTTTGRKVFSGTEDNFVWAMTKDPNGNLIAGTTGNGHGNDSNDVRLYGSEDGGLSWGTLKNFADNDDWDGVKWLSQRFDDQGYGYYAATEDDGAGFDTYRYRLIHTPHARLVSSVCRPPQEGRAGRGRSRGGRR